MMYQMMKPLSPLFSDPFFREFFHEPQIRRPRHPDMQVRIHETENAYLLESDLPGVGRENISLSVEGNVLTIAALRRFHGRPQAEDKPEAQPPKHEHRMERRFEMEGVDTEAITADYVDGVLKLTLPKVQPEEKPAVTHIAIGGGDQPAALTE